MFVRFENRLRLQEICLGSHLQHLTSQTNPTGTAEGRPFSGGQFEDTGFYQLTNYSITDPPVPTTHTHTHTPVQPITHTHSHCHDSTSRFPRHKHTHTHCQI